MSKNLQNAAPIVALMVLLASVWLGASPARAQSEIDRTVIGGRNVSGDVMWIMWSSCAPDQNLPNRGTCDGPNGPTQVACLRTESLHADGMCSGFAQTRMERRGCLLYEAPMSDGSCGIGGSVGCNTGDEMRTDIRLIPYCYRTAGQQPRDINGSVFRECDPLAVDAKGMNPVTGTSCRYEPAYVWRTTGYLPYQAREISWFMSVHEYGW
jgi:hypothetical protein